MARKNDLSVLMLVLAFLAAIGENYWLAVMLVIIALFV